MELCTCSDMSKSFFRGTFNEMKFYLYLSYIIVYENTHGDYIQKVLILFFYFKHYNLYFF